MSDFSGLSFGKKKNNINFNIDGFKGGIKINENIDEKVQLFASKIDKNQDKILDNDEISEFINQVKFFAKDNNLSMREAVKLISNYQIEELTADDLQAFMAFIDEESKYIEESTAFVDNNGQKTVFIKYSDGKEETIFPDKTSQLIYTGVNDENIVEKYDANEQLSEKTITSKDGSVRKIQYLNDLPTQEVIEQEGSITEILYDEGGKPISKTIKKGLRVENYIFKNNQYLLTKLTETDKGEEIVTTFEYDDRNQLIRQNRMRDTDNSTEILNTYDNDNLIQITKNVHSKNDKYKRDVTIVLNLGDNGNYTSGNYHIENLFLEDKEHEPWPINIELKFDDSGNLVGHAPNRLTLEQLFRDMEIDENDPLYQEFMELNKDNIKSYNNGRVQTFGVGDEIKFPPEFVENISNLTQYLSIDPKEEREQYSRYIVNDINTDFILSSSINVEEEICWWDLSKKLLVQSGNANPSEAEIADYMNLLFSLNNVFYDKNKYVEKGSSVEIPLNTSDFPERFILGKYSPQSLEKQYPADKFVITERNCMPEEDEYGYLKPAYSYTVTDKVTGKKVLEVMPIISEGGYHFNKSYQINQYDENENIINVIEFSGSYIKETNNGKTTEYNIQNTINMVEETFTDNNGFKVKVRYSGNQKKVDAEKGDEFYYETYENGKLKERIDKNGKHWYDSNGELLYTVKYHKRAPIVTSPIFENMLQCIIKQDSEQLMKEVLKIDESNFSILLYAYKNQITNGDLIKILTENSAIDVNTRGRIKNHFANLLAQYDVQDFSNRSSSIKNDNYNGSEFLVTLKDNVITVKKVKTGEVEELNLNTLFKNLTTFEKAFFKKGFSQLPGEVLFDYAKECSTIHVSSEANNLKDNPDFRESGHYSSFYDDITIIDEQLYPLPFFDETNEERNSKTILTLSEVLTHELAHAVDFNGVIFNTPESKDELMEIFEDELENNYLPAGNVQYSYEKGFEVKYNDNFEATSCYATANVKEMFAECYTLLLNGDCQSKDHIQKYFPRSLAKVKEMIREVRSLSDDVRH
mgnify:CR=1 FL=1